MATLTFERNTNTAGSPTWTSYGANTIVFSGSPTDLAATISTAAWNDGTHTGTGDPGTDACGSPGGPGGGGAHNSNVKYLTSGTWNINAGGSEAVGDAQILDGEVTFRIHLNNASAVSTQNSRMFSFNGTTDTTEAVEIECFAWQKYNSETAWTSINDDSGNIGGDNSGEFLNLAEQGPATDIYWYVAVSARGETAGAKTAFDFKIITEIF